jgi:hypothetical protein
LLGPPEIVGRKIRRAEGIASLCHVSAPVLSRDPPPAMLRNLKRIER